MRKTIAALFFLPLLAVADSWMPPMRPLPDLTALTGKDEVVATSPVVGEFKPGELRSVQSLEGTWKLSPLETSGEPYGRMDDSEQKFTAADFDDSGWNSIRVPLNWYLHPKNAYNKIFRHGEMLDPVSVGGGLVRGIVNSNVKGWYRHTLELDKIPAGKRAVMTFERIGYQAELFVNGRPAPVEHQGDFVSYQADVTDLLKPRKNIIALRVRAGVRPIHGRFPHTYGAMWDWNSYKGGIWGHVRLHWLPEPRVESIKLVTPASGKLEVYADVVYSGKEPLEVTPGISVVKARKGSIPNSREYPAVKLNPGVNKLKFSFDEPDPELWSFNHPNLYFATLFFRGGDEILSADTTRFGFRDFEVKNGRFYLNGNQTYLFFESAHSIHFGGFRTEDGHSVRPMTRIGEYKKRGYNMIRTAHMPVSQEVLDCADELGMMVYDEWSMCFITGIDKEVFEKNNLRELTRFIADDHNHPSVVMWSLGNEVSHKRDPELTVQLDKQYDLVRELDLQKRPICSFAGLGDMECYGRAKVKTDVIDLHCYIGMTDSWTLTKLVSNHYYRQLAEVYGDGKTFEQPFIISECVGGGWGYTLNPDYKSNVPEYLKIMKRPFHWGEPGSAGYSGAIGVAAAADPKRASIYLQNRLGRRILELFRLDQRYSGYSPWFADHKMQSAPVWNQEYYPGLRLPGSFAPRQLLAGTTVEVEGFLLNEGERNLAAPELEIALRVGDGEFPLGRIKFPASRPGLHLFDRLPVTIPQGVSGSGELKLTVFEGKEAVGFNSYAVTVHALPVPLDDSLPVAVLSDDPELKKWLKKMNIHAETVTAAEELQKYSRAVVAGRGELSRGFTNALRQWVRNGGFLLALECESGYVPAFSEYGYSSIGAPMVEMVAVEHPLFAGLQLDDFDVWAENPSGFVAVKALAPMDETLLAANGVFTHNRNCGMVIAEGGFGKGRVLVSTLNARRIAERNGAAAQWMGKLLRYFASANAKLATPVNLKPRERKTEFSADMSKAVHLDLRPYANRGFRDEKENDGQGGWTDQGENDFRNMPSGRQRDAGVLFELIDSVQNNGNGCIMLQGRGWPQGPAAVNGIPVGAKANELYFLHTAAFVAENAPVGHYLVRYADGSTARIPLVSGVNIGDWWFSSPPESAFPAFSRPNALTGNVTFYAAKWENPTTEKEIGSIDFVSAGKGASVALAAVTLLPASGYANLVPFESGKQQWVCGSVGNGAKAAAKVVMEKNPVGRQVMRVEFPAAGKEAFPFAIAPVNLQGMKGRTPTHLSILFRSNSEGVIDVQIPEKAWKSSLSAPLELGRSQGEWVRVRLDLRNDFKLRGSKFDLAALRSEIGFFNGKDREFGYPRNQVAFEVADIRYEFN